VVHAHLAHAGRIGERSEDALERTDDRAQVDGAAHTVVEAQVDAVPSRAVGEVTRILEGIEGGDPSSAERLFPLVYEELRRLAGQRLAHERPGQTLQATALVHEAYLRLVDVERAQRWNSRGHFFAAAAEAMRRILVESARRKARVRHGGGLVRCDVGLGDVAAPMSPDDLIALDEALEALRREDPVKAQLVSLRFFAGLPEAEAAAILSISRATASRQWRYARAWLHRHISRAKGGT
jgi:RNA polymerase sigma factor (TIGR02999 family)